MEIGVILAFLAGILSFFSPCVLPLVIPYISLISGISVANIKSREIENRERTKIIFSTLCFVVGFTVVFILFGIVAGQVGGVLTPLKNTLSKIAGLIIIIFGLYLMGILKIPFLDYEKRIDILSSRRGGYLSAFLMGISFAFGWTPCVGPVLGGIIGIAFHSGNTVYGGVLLGVYSLGLSIPFFITSIFVNTAIRSMSKLKKTVSLIKISSGTILTLIGIAVATDSLGVVSNYIIELFPFLRGIG